MGSDSGTKKKNFEYPLNVRFKCIKCGMCCGDTHDRNRHILLLDEEANLIAKTKNQLITSFASEVRGKKPYRYRMKKTSNAGKCVFLAESRCTLYSRRPLICRFYPFGLKTNRTNRPVIYFTSECPGIGKGKPMKENDFNKLLEEADKRIATNSRNVGV